jgi:hypothetical protein
MAVAIPAFDPPILPNLPVVPPPTELDQQGPVVAMRARFVEISDAAEREQMAYRGFLAELLMAECDDRDRRRSERRIKTAGFPREK